MTVKITFYLIAKVMIIIIVALIILSAAAFAFLKWLADYEIKVAVGQKFPLLMMVDNQPVDEKSYMAHKENDPSIYFKEAEDYVYPLVRLTQDPVMLTRLCLVDFTGDTIYRAFELQAAQQDDSEYYILIMYRQDGVADIYYSRGLNVNTENLRALLNEVNLIETSFNEVDFFVTEKGLDVSVSIMDKQNRTVAFSIKENKSKPGNYRIIAPVGDTSKDPENFPVIFLNDFNMVQKRGTVISVSIDDVPMKPQELFPLYDYTKVYLSRYSGQVVMKQLNPNYSGEVKPIAVPEGATEVTYDGNTYSVSNNDGHKEIGQIMSEYGDIEVRIKFSPALPDITAIKDDMKIEGHFSIGIGEADGMLGGTYNIIRHNDSISFQMNPQIGWQPMPGDLWMKTYIWNADIQIDGDSLDVNSNWSRMK